MLIQKVMTLLFSSNIQKGQIMEIENIISGLIASESGNLMVYLQSLPRDQWSDEFFVFACSNNQKNYDALVALCLQGVEFGNDYRDCVYDLLKDSKKLEIMVAYGLNMKMKRRGHFTLLDVTECPKSAKVLIANGMRVDSSEGVYVCEDPKLIKFQRGVITCRDVIVVLLGLKKKHRLSVLPQLDRLLIKEVLAVEIWSTRTDRAWRKQTLIDDKKERSKRWLNEKKELLKQWLISRSKTKDVFTMIVTWIMFLLSFWLSFYERSE